MVCIKILKKHSRLRASLQTELGIGDQYLNLVLVVPSLIVLFGINQRHLKTRIHLKTNISCLNGTFNQDNLSLIYMRFDLYDFCIITRNLGNLFSPDI